MQIGQRIVLFRWEQPQGTVGQQCMQPSGSPLAMGLARGPPFLYKCPQPPAAHLTQASAPLWASLFSLWLNGISSWPLLITLWPPEPVSPKPLLPWREVGPFLSGLQGQRRSHEVPRGRWLSGFFFTLECDFPFQLETTQDGKFEQGSLSSAKTHQPLPERAAGAGGGGSHSRPTCLKPGTSTGYHPASFSFPCPLGWTQGPVSESRFLSLAMPSPQGHPAKACRSCGLCGRERCFRLWRQK